MVTGLPTDDVDSLIGNLIWLELLLALAGVAAAATIGSVVVRRQLRPLREVAATAHEVSTLPLSEGAIDLSPRVPERLTDEATEVGQVGSALNTLLSHVETSLSARHASELQVRQFVADASHELRTPLATIKGYAELSRRRPDDAEALLGRPRTRSSRRRGGCPRWSTTCCCWPASTPAGRWSARPSTSPTCCSRPSPTPGCSAPTTSGGSSCPRRPSRSSATRPGCTRW